jgi:uncharacterized protein YndB with AHSA1/START domain
MKTKIIAEPGKQELFIHRVFDAPVDLVFKAFSDPDILIKFFAPKGIKMEFLQEGYKEGSPYRYRHINSEGKIFCTFKGVNHEMKAPERIVLTTEAEDIPYFAHAMLDIYEFEEIEKDKTRLIIQEIYRSVKVRDEVIESGMEGGVISIFNNLDELLAKDLNTVKY